MFLELLILSPIYILLPPIFFIISITLFLAVIGQSLGVRRLYIDFLLKVFEYAHNSKEKKDHEGAKNGFFVGKEIPDSDSSEEDEDLESLGPGSPNGKDAKHFAPPLRKLSRAKTRHNVISRRDNLILVPNKLEQIQKLNESFEDGGFVDGGAEECEKEENSLPRKILGGRSVSLNTFKQDFQLSDVLDYVKTGVAAIIEDEVTQRFVAEDLKSWNLMTRSHSQFEFINWRVTIFYVWGTVFRYFILFPARLAVMVFALSYMVVTCFWLGLVPHQGLRQWLYEKVATIVFQLMSRCFSASITFHNLENRPKQDGICVANHTSPIDVVILSTDRSYALVGQSHGGFLGLVQRSLSRAAAHIWFQRSEVKDRAAVARRLREHVEDPETLPILIFPEGTCINNTSVMQFKKGSFEVGGMIYPVAIKYDSKFGDAFWNSSRYNMFTYILMMMTSWAIVCDVWYLPPMERVEGEDAIHFANRVKKDIARKGGLVDLVWDGNLKRQEVKSEWKAAAQQQFSRRLSLRPFDLGRKPELVTSL